MATPKDPHLANSIQETKRRARRKKAAPEAARVAPEATAPDSTKSPGKATAKPNVKAVPDEVREKFTLVGDRYHFKDGALAFWDRGNKITSPSENTEVIRSIVAIAQARGWTGITVTGTERFRRDAWFAARLTGIEVRGYEPTEFEQERLARTLAREEAPSRREPQGRERGDSGSRPGVPRGRDDRERLYLGRLIEHGQAPYRHDEKNSPSYFLRLKTPDGERELWGIDLERALKQSLTKPKVGDEIGLRALRRDAVKVWGEERDADGEPIAQKRVEAHRNVWVVESKAFFASRLKAARTLQDPSVGPKEAVREHPELLGSYLQLRAAELASVSIRDREDQRRFVATVRRALADSIARGEPMPPVRLKDSERVPLSPELLQAQEPSR
jgi:hypothetical protein